MRKFIHVLQKEKEMATIYTILLNIKINFDKSIKYLHSNVVEQNHYLEAEEINPIWSRWLPSVHSELFKSGGWFPKYKRVMENCDMGRFSI